MRKYPKMCFYYLSTVDKIVVIKWGETGYYETTYDEKGNRNQEFANYINNQLGLSPEEAEAMVICSMCRELSIEEWEQKYDYILKCVKENKK